MKKLIFLLPCRRPLLLTMSLSWKSWLSPIPEWWKQLETEEKGGDLWIQIGNQITETQARHLYSQWFLGRGWATPPTESETLPKPYWNQVLRWKLGKEDFSIDETTWLQLEGEEAIRRIWTTKGDWDKAKKLPNPSTCPFEGFVVNRVVRETQMLSLEDKEYDVNANYYLDKMEKATEKDGEWKWRKKEMTLEWSQEYIFPFHAKPLVELRLKEIRSGPVSDFWVHHRNGPFFEKEVHRELWMHIPWRVIDGQNITPNARGRKSRSLVNPDKLHWNIEGILTDISAWITSLLQDLQGSYIISSKSQLDAVMKEFPKVKLPSQIPLTREWYHEHSLLKWVAQEDKKGQRGFVWVSKTPGEMLWWFGKTVIPLGWMGEGWGGSLWEGILVGNQQTIYLRDTLYLKGKDVRDLPFQVVSKKKVVDRWSGVLDLVKDMTKKGTTWRNLPDLDPEWRVMIQAIQTLSSPEGVWEGLPEEEKKNKEAVAWFVGEWIRTIEKESNKPTGLAGGPLTAGQRLGLTWRPADEKYQSEIPQWHFPSMLRVSAVMSLVKDKDGMPIVKQTERLGRAGKMGKGGNAIEYQGYVLAQLMVRDGDEMTVWRPRRAPARSGEGANPGDGSTPDEGGAFQVGIPITGGAITSYMVNGARGDNLRDGDIVLWELEKWEDLDANLFAWRPVARMPKNSDVATVDEIQGAWDSFRAPITEQDWREGRVPSNDPLPIPLPGAEDIPTGDVMPAGVATVGEQEDAIDKMEAVAKTTDQTEEYYVKREGAGAKLPWSYFHNQIVKRELYREVAPAWADLRAESKNVMSLRRPNFLEPDGLLVDFASGELHDYTKWSDAAFQRVVGLEKYEVAVERSYEIVQEFQSTYRGYKPRCEFVWADMTRLVFPDRDAGEDEDAKKRLAELLPSKYMADVVSVQFALHYAAGNEHDLRAALLNVSDSLKVGGYFISTFFDAERVHALLKGAKNGKANGIRVGAGGEQEWAWQIQRKYQPAKWGSTKLNLGHAIEVLVSSIGHSHEEYLLPMTTLTAFAKEVGLELVSQTSFESIWASVPRTNKHYAEIQKMSDAEKTFSFLNQTVIFQKMRQAPDSAYALVRKLEGKKAVAVKTRKVKEEPMAEVKEVVVDMEEEPEIVEDVKVEK